MFDIATYRVLFGLSFLIPSILFALIHFILIVLIRKSTTLSTVPYYQCAIHVSITDAFQLLFNGLPTSFYLFYNSTSAFFVDKILGAILNSTFFVFIYFAALIAFNRLCYIFCRRKTTVDRLFSERKMRFFVAMGWCQGLGFFVLYSFTECTFRFSIDRLSFGYDEGHLSKIVQRLELIIDSVYLVIMAASYTLILIKLKITNNRICSEIISSQVKKRKVELRVLIQASILCGMVTVTTTAFFGLPSLTNNRYCFLLINYLWIMTACANACVLLVFNRCKFNRLIVENV
uniref:7TM GPCR serpentine receptor class x (Srx) domain-containing protein n=1 Tax=Romanomermis culicivorax TaxID=13658 RepID=A0A915L011_ROMCU